MTPELETARLLLRPLELSDADQAQELFAHWEIVRFLFKEVPWPYPPDGSLTYIRDVALPAIERGEQWSWTLRLKTNPEQMIGLITLQKSREGRQPRILDGAAVARARAHDRGGGARDRLLV